jgi:hypothetical protein
MDTQNRTFGPQIFPWWRNFQLILLLWWRFRVPSDPRFYGHPAYAATNGWMDGDRIFGVPLYMCIISTWLIEVLLCVCVCDEPYSTKWGTNLSLYVDLLKMCIAGVGVALQIKTCGPSQC